MVSVTQFPDHFREEVYWLSESGQLLGVLPALGKGPHGFFSATLSSRPSLPVGHATPTAGLGAVTPTEDDSDDGGLYVFFSDGMGGIVCLRPVV